MADGVYIALNGLRARLNELDRVAADLSNIGTAGYKGDRTSTYGDVRPTFDAIMQKATDPAIGERKVNLSAGEVSPTGRDLDFALEGKGFFAVQTPAGIRYTRNGSFQRSADGTLKTADGLAVLGGETPPAPITLGPGEVTVDPDGTVRAGGVAAGRLTIVEPAVGATIIREGAARFRMDQVVPVDNPSVRNHALEQSNVSMTDAMAHLTALSRNFDALQRGLVSLMSEVDGKAISELGRH
jgi:flagellar basal body rod protein FlgG